MSEENISKSEDLKLYELSFHIVSSVPEDKLNDEVSLIKNLLDKNGAEITSSENPKLIDLAYTMVKKVHDANYRYDKAYFGWFKFNATSVASEEIKNELEKMDTVLRFLLIKTINDPEHSTNKIESEKKKRERAEAMDDEAEDEKDETDGEVDGDSEDDDKKEIDEAIDDLVK